MARIPSTTALHAGNRGVVGDVVHQGRSADRKGIDNRLGAEGGIEDHVDLIVLDGIDNVRAPFLDLVDRYRRDPWLLKKAAVPRVATISKPAATSLRAGSRMAFLSASLTLMKTLPASGSSHVGGQLGLGKGLAEVSVDPHDLTGRFHLRPEQGIDAGEFDKGEDRFLDRDVLRHDLSE